MNDRSEQIKELYSLKDAWKKFHINEYISDQELIDLIISAKKALWWLDAMGDRMYLATKEVSSNILELQRRANYRKIDPAKYYI